jgi:transposase-like protein
MTPVELSSPIYSDEEKARKHFEAIRWPNGPVCFHCGSVGDAIRPLDGKSMGDGWYYCTACKDKFTARMGTVLERSHIPVHKWLLAMRLMASSKKGISAHQLHRTLKVTYKTAWFLAHRIREAMRDDGSTGPLGGEGKIIEADETLYGPPQYRFSNDKGWFANTGPGGKSKVLSLVERGGRVRSFKADQLTSASVQKLVEANADLKSRLMTDAGLPFKRVGKKFASHQIVNHSKGEYGRGDVTTNSVEGYFSVFKRGMKGVYQHCGEQHLHRYLNEFDFRHSNRAALGVDDAERTTRAIRGVKGKRLMYRQPDRTA